MCIDATDEWRVYMVTNEPLHYKVDLGFVIALSSDVSVQTCKVLRKLLLERRPNKLLSVELAAICRNEQNLEWLVVLAHLMTVVCGQVVNDEVDLSLDVEVVKQLLKCQHEVLPRREIALWPDL